MVEVKKCCNQTDTGNYPDGRMICLKSFSVGHLPYENKLTLIIMMKRNYTCQLFHGHTKCTIHDLGNDGKNKLDTLKSCCHHSLKDLCVQTDGAWWKLKRYCSKLDINNLSGGCMICLKSFSVGHILSVNKSTKITMMKWNETETETETNAWFVQVGFFHVAT